MHTYGSALALSNIDVPKHLDRNARVPILTGVQAQGDLLVVPIDRIPEPRTWRSLPDAGVPLVENPQTGNTHWLHRGLWSPGVRWSPTTDWGTTIAYLRIPAGQSAQLLHTEEHGANGIGAGLYALRRKQQRAFIDPASERDETSDRVTWVED